MTEVIIKTNDADQRFDRFLRKAYPKLSLSKIQKLIRTGRIKLNGKKVKNDQRLILNDKIQLYVSLEYISANPNTKDFKLSNPNINIVYEDENLLVVNKPRGVVVHIDESKTPRTLINQILHYLYLKHAYDPDAEQSFVPTLLHRIDMNTVGLVMCAKNAATARILMEKIKQHEVDKYYWCKVYGKVQPPHRILKDYWTRSEISKTFTITKNPIKASSALVVTEYQLIKYQNGISTLEIKLVTGKTHQIRAHLNFIGHPLLGEKKYTTSSFKDTYPSQYLIAYKITFNFKSDAGILNYLKGKTIKIDHPEKYLYPLLSY